MVSALSVQQGSRNCMVAMWSCRSGGIVVGCKPKIEIVIFFTRVPQRRATRVGMLVLQQGDAPHTTPTACTGVMPGWQTAV